MKKKVSSLKIFLLMALIIILAVLLIRMKNKRDRRTVIKPEEYIIQLKGAGINEDDFKDVFLEKNPELKEMDDEYYLSALKKDFAYKLADEMILKDFAAKSGIRVTKDELSQEIEKLKNGYTSESFSEMLESEGITYANLSASVEERLLMKKLLHEKAYGDIEVSDDEIADFYHRFKGNYRSTEKYKIDKISVQDEARANEVFEKLSSKELDFEAAKEEYSLAESEVEIQEEDYIPTSGLSEEFFDALSDLKPGATTGIIVDSSGYHILKLIDRAKARQLKLDEVKESIRRLLREQKEKVAYNVFIRKLREEYEVVISDDYFKVPEDEK